MRREWILQISIIGLAVCLISISVGIAFSITPLYITSVLGFTVGSVGIIEGVTEALAQGSKLLSGILSDYFKKKKPLLIFGFLLAAISKPLFILANGFSLILASKVLERLSNGIMATPRDTYVVEIAPAKYKSTCLSVIMSFKFIGVIAGSLLTTLFLYLTQNNYLLIMWIGFGLSVLALSILMFYMKEPLVATPVPQSAPISSSKFIKMQLSEIKLLPPYFWLIVLIAAIFMCSRFSESFIILYIEFLGGPKTLCASIIAIENIISVLSCVPIGYLSDRLNRPAILGISIFAHCLAHLCLILADSVSIGLIGVILWGIQRASSQILFISLIADVTPKHVLGTAVGIYYLAAGVTSLIAGIIAGWLGDHVSFKAIFVFGFSMATTSLLLFTACHRPQKRQLAVL